MRWAWTRPPVSLMSTGGEYVYAALRQAGITHAIGLPGRGTLPLDLAIRNSDEMTYVLARDETAIPYIAWGYYQVTGRPAATITVPGPGDTNASNGLRNATIDRVPIVHICSEVPPASRGTGYIHEIDPSTYDDVVKANVDVPSPGALPDAVDRGIERALTPPYGPVRLGIPWLDAELNAPTPEIKPTGRTSDNGDEYDRASTALASAERPVVYAGAGTKRAPGGPAAVRTLVETLDAPVVSSYAGKGTFDETDPRWVGTTGAQLPAGAEHMLDRADVVLALGTSFGGPTTLSGRYAMGETLIHVSTDPASFGGNYDADIELIDDVASACHTLQPAVDDRDASSGWSGQEIGPPIRQEYVDVLADAALFADRAPAPTPAVVRTLRTVLDDDAIIAADIAEFRTWAMQLFEAPYPDSFIATGSWTSMGVGLPGAIGAKLAAPDRPVVCLTGDGGLLQCVGELHTVAEYDLDITTVVFNNAQLAMISTTPGMAADDRFGWESPDFVRIAEGFGWDGHRVRTPSAVADAMEQAAATDGPVLIDVEVDPDEPSSMDAWEYETNISLY